MNFADHVNRTAAPPGQFTLPEKQSLKVTEFTKHGQEFRVLAVDIATVLVLLTISIYKLHPAVILENITVAQPAKKLSQLIEPKGIDLLPCSRSLVLGSRLWLKHSTVSRDSSFIRS